MNIGSQDDCNHSQKSIRASSALWNRDGFASRSLRNISRARSAVSLDRYNTSLKESAPFSVEPSLDYSSVQKPRRGFSASSGFNKKSDKHNLDKRNQVKCPMQGEYYKNGKKYLRIVTHDHVRDILIPSQKRNVQTDLIDYDNYSNIKQLATTRREDAVHDINEKRDKERHRMKEESLKRKRELQKFQTTAYVDPSIIEKEKEANITAKMVRERAIKALQEQDDDMKKFNSLILSSKCNAIRDAQIIEKKMIEEAIEKEERRQYKLMEEERLKGLKELESRKQRAQEERQRFIRQLEDQVKANHEARASEADKLMEERLLEREAFLLGDNETANAEQRKREKSKKLKDEMNRINIFMKALNERNKQEERMLDQQIQEYANKKLKEAKAREEEKQLSRLERERFIIKMREKQREMATNQQLKDEIRSLKSQNEVEKQWRIKEREIEEKRKKQTQELKEERDRQIRERLKVQAIELEMEKKEYVRSKILLDEFKQAQLEEASNKNKAKEELRKSLLEQINEKEKRKAIEREKDKQAVLETLMKINYNESVKKQIMMEKINEIKAHNVPEKYVLAVERSCLKGKPF